MIQIRILPKNVWVVLAAFLALEECACALILLISVILDLIWSVVILRIREIYPSVTVAALCATLRVMIGSFLFGMLGIVTVTVGMHLLSDVR